MKRYTKPFVEITSYEAENIVLLSGLTDVKTDYTGVQTDIKDIKWSLRS
jgi:hypothetical protein